VSAPASLLAAYVPRLLREWTEVTPHARFREVPGSLVFVDISGFTRLSERLARKGKVGAEELTDTIDACFADLLPVAYDNGGSLIKFGGDALLLLFTDSGHPAKAARAAEGMRRTLRDVGRR
jgi:class 3 adenylate cyclase